MSGPLVFADTVNGIGVLEPAGTRSVTGHGRWTMTEKKAGKGWLASAPHPPVVIQNAFVAGVKARLVIGVDCGRTP